MSLRERLRYGKYPTKTIEWKFGNNAYLRYLIGLKLEDMKYYLGVEVIKAKSKDYDFFSLCKRGNL